MLPHPYRKAAAWALLAVGVGLVLLTSWPLPSQSVHWTVAADSASYTISLEWPSLVRVGEKHAAVLVVEQAAASMDDQSSPKLLETRLEFNHLIIDPSAKVTQPLGSTGVNEFRWSVIAGQAGKSSGTLWIYAASPDETDMPQALAARTLELRAVGPGRTALLSLRWLGAVLLVLGGFLLVRFFFINNKPVGSPGSSRTS